MLVRNITVAALLWFSTMMSDAALSDELKFAHFMSSRYSLHEGLFLPFAEQLNQATNGEVSVRVYPGGELGAGPAKQYDRAVDGVADIVFGLPGYTASKFPVTLLVELPGVANSEEAATRAIWKHIEYLNREYRRVKLLSLWTNPAGALFTRDKPIHALDDLKGLKIRVPSRNSGKVVAAWGATPVSMPITEVYNSLQTGVIDGVLVDPSVLVNFKLHEVVHYMTTGMKSTLTPQFIIMNRGAWDSLDGKQQAALEKLAGFKMAEAAHLIQTREASLGVQAFRDAGNTVIELSPAEAARFDALSDELVDSQVAELEAAGVKAAAYVQALRQE